MVQEAEGKDRFYSESNIRYLEELVRDVKEGRAHFAEHDLMEVEDECNN